MRTLFSNEDICFHEDYFTKFVEQLHKLKESITLSYQPPSIKLWAAFSEIKSKLQGVQMIPGSQNDIYMLLLMHQVLYPVTHLHRINFIEGGYQTNCLMQPCIKINLCVLFH
jgi:hypothetical protein